MMRSGKRKENLDMKHIAMQIKMFVDVQRNYRNASLTSSDVADALGISRTSLAKIMKITMNTTFTRYLLECRLKHARRHVCLKGDSASAEHIAALTGFATLRTSKEKYQETYGIQIH